MPERGNYELSNDHNGHGSSESSSRLAQEASAANTPFWETTGFKQGSSEAVGTFAAGLTGILTFSAGTAMKRYQLLKAGTVALAPVLGGCSKHGVKEGVDNLLHLSGKDKSASTNDYYTGALDAVAGITGSMAEQKASHWYTGYVGRRELTRGSASAAGGLKHELASWLTKKPPTTLVSDKTALTEGERILSQYVMPQITHNILRGTVGSTVGSLTWSAPHRVFENIDAIKKDNLGGTLKTMREIGTDVAIGTVIGGGTAGLVTTALNGRYIARYLKAHVEGDEGLTRLTAAHTNDAHSQTQGERNFARASTKITDIREASQALDNSNDPGIVCWQDVPESERLSRWWNQFIGKEAVMKNNRTYRNDAFFDNGDTQNANVSSTFTGWGKLEDFILRKMGPSKRSNDPNRKGGLTSATDGNHSNDKIGGGVDNERRARMISEHNEIAGEKLPLVVGNQETSELSPELHNLYKDIWRPFLVHELKGPQGKPVKAATIGLVTEEASTGGIKYQDPFARLEQIISDIKKEHPDLNIFIVQSHLGDELDRQIAARNKDVSAIFGAHSHKAFGRPVWINNGAREVPILQAGAYLSHVGEADLAYNVNGSVNRFHSTAKLHAITSQIEEDPVIVDIIAKGTPKELAELQSQSYNAQSVAKYSIDSARTGESALANMVVDAVEAQFNRLLPHLKGKAIIGAQSGALRAPIPANQELTRFDISKIPINSGIKENEALEQVLVEIPGHKFIEALEFGCSDLNSPAGFAKQLWNRIITGKPLPNTDDPQGNLLHFNGSYTTDFSKPVGQRTSNHLLKQAGQLVPLVPEDTYPWLTRWHYLEKLHKSGVFNYLAEDGIPLTIEEVYRKLSAQPYEHSIVDAIGDHIRNKTLNPNIEGKIEGRLINKTPQPFSLQFGPGPSLFSFPVLSGRDTMSDDQKTH